MLLNKRSINIAWWTGKLGSALVEWLRNKDERVFIWSRTWEWEDAYRIWSWDIFWPKSIWVIATTGGIVQEILETDFRDIPTIIATTWYEIDDILKRPWVRVDASNLALPIVSLFKLFSEFWDFSDMTMKIRESHQAGKKDHSGTAERIRQSFVAWGWVCDLQNTEWYKAHEWISDLWGIITYRWNASKEMNVSDEFIQGHAYHNYEITWSWENFERFKRKIEEWNDIYGNKWYTGYSSSIISRDEKSICFGHTIDGRDIYADGLHELLPKIESLKPKEGLYSISDLL